MITKTNIYPQNEGKMKIEKGIAIGLLISIEGAIIQ